MINKIKRFFSHPIFQKISNIWGTGARLVGSVWNIVLSPFRPILDPIQSRWMSLTAPIRTRWATFAQRSPTVAFIVGTGISLAKWGFFTLVALILGVWTGLFGHMPNKEELKRLIEQ